MAVDPPFSPLNRSKNITPPLIPYDETLRLAGRYHPSASRGQHQDS
jgi:hypothetical protein